MPPKGKRKQSIGLEKDVGNNERLRKQSLPERSVAPFSTQDPSVPLVNKELAQRDKKDVIAKYQEVLDMKLKENEKEVKKTLIKINFLRKENDRIQRRQTATYGMTLDMLEGLKYTLENTKSQNAKLYEDMAEAKQLYEQLEVNLKEVRGRHTETVHHLNQLKSEATQWDATKNNFVKAEMRCQYLHRNNKRLKILCLKHHIDPSTDAKELDRDTDKGSIKTFRTTSESQRRQLTVKSRYRSVGDVELMRKLNDLEIKRGHGVMAATFDQVSPAYLGYYFKRKETKRDDGEYIRTGIKLPRLIAGK